LAKGGASAPLAPLLVAPLHINNFIITTPAAAWLREGLQPP